MVTGLKEPWPSDKPIGHETTREHEDKKMNKTKQYSAPTGKYDRDYSHAAESNMVTGLKESGPSVKPIRHETTREHEDEKMNKTKQCSAPTGKYEREK